jgi:hypothetical protein
MTQTIDRVIEGLETLKASLPPMSRESRGIVNWTLIKLTQDVAELKREIAESAKVKGN